MTILQPNYIEKEENQHASSYVYIPMQPNVTLIICIYMALYIPVRAPNVQRGPYVHVPSFGSSVQAEAFSDVHKGLGSRRLHSLKGMFWEPRTRNLENIVAYLGPCIPYTCLLFSWGSVLRVPA